ncbi:hypothetical protein SOCE26_047900 [Sorangium cellulosum]|uniref:Secreted protein n=1 Tax=Sorangium cellulosum TaxID=56 RepID=A0A2L0EVN8_SORCE|nr:hypothetical protein [Sorangium cellulosum]AUX43342.1 hypothetical protein SOCE26_047900 [Sorangium cellulosum]
MRSWTWLSLLAVPALTACAAVADAPPSARGGEETSGAGGGGGRVGGSDLPRSCGTLELAEPSLRLAERDTDLLDPQWVIGAGADAPLYLYAAATTPSSGRVLQRATLDPWSEQPATFSEPTLVLDSRRAPVHGNAFAVAPLRPSYDSNYESIVFYREHSKQQQVDYLPPVFQFRATPAWSHGGPPAAPAWEQDIGEYPGDRIVTLRPNDSGTAHLAILELEEPGPRYSLMRTLLTNTVHHSSTIFTLGCATTPIAFDAAWDQGSWLFGAALGAPTAWESGWQPCDVRYPGVGPAKTIYLGRHFRDESGSGTITSNEAISEAAPVARLRVAPRPDGAWLAWSLAPVEDAPGALRVARMTRSASAALPPVTVPSCFSLVPGSLAAEQVEGDLVVAVVETSTDGSDRIVLRRLNAGGEVTWMKTVYPTGKVEGSLAMVAQGGRGLLLAWAERSSSASAAQLRAARFDCAEESGAIPACDVEAPIPR